eukprot:Hpha_TRINITY_DN15581_c1_g2::TRINITY_DN15581_c1_g2_i1::g.104219::m.104219
MTDSPSATAGGRATPELEASVGGTMSGTPSAVGRGGPMPLKQRPSRGPSRTEEEPMLMDEEDFAGGDYQAGPSRRVRKGKIRKMEDEDDKVALEHFKHRAMSAERKLKRTWFFVGSFLGAGALIGAVVMGIEVGKASATSGNDDNNNQAATSLQHGNVQCEVSGCGDVDITKEKCMAVSLADEALRLKTMYLYQNIQEEKLLYSGDNKPLKITTRSILNWTDPAGATIFNAWAHDARRPGFQLDMQQPNVSLEDLNATIPTVKMTGATQAYGVTLEETISIKYVESQLAIRSHSVSPGGNQSINLQAITDEDTVWQEAVADEPLTLDAENHADLNGPEEKRLVSQSMNVTTTIKVEYMVDAVSFMNIPANNAPGHMTLHLEDGRVRKLTGVTTDAIPIAGSLSNNGQSNVAVKTSNIPGPLKIGEVTLKDMSITFDKTSDYKFKATADFPLGSKTFTLTVEGVIGYQPRKTDVGENMHNMLLVGSTPELVLLEGDKTEVKVKPFEIRLSGYLETGLQACDGTDTTMPCVKLALPPDFVGPTSTNPGQIAVNHTDTSDVLGPILPDTTVTYCRWRVEAFVSGKIFMGNVNAAFEFPLKPNSEMFDKTTRKLDIALSNIELSPAITLNSGRLEWYWPSGDFESAELQFETEIETGGRNVTVGLIGRATPGKLDLTGTLANWHIPFGENGLTVNNLVADLDIEWEVDFKPADRCAWTTVGKKAVHSHHHVDRPQGSCPSMADQKVYTEQACKDACEAEPLCMSIEFMPSQGQCCLLDCHVGTGECKVEVNSAEEYIIDNCGVRGEVSGFTGPFADHGITGFNDLDVVYDTDLKNCADRCAAQSACNTFEYMNEKSSNLYRSCWLSSATRDFAGKASWQVWPGWDFYEKPGAVKPGHASGGAAVNVSDSDAQLHTANETRLAERKWALALNSTLTFGGSEWDFAFQLKSWSTEGSFVTLQAKPGGTLGGLVSGANGGTAPDSTDTMGLLGMTPTAVRIYLNPMWLRATVNTYVLPSSGMRVIGVLTVREIDGGYKWGVAVQSLHDNTPDPVTGEIPSAGFKLSDLIANAPAAFDSVEFSHGLLAVSNYPMNVTVVPQIEGFHDLGNTIEVGPGFLFSGAIGLIDVAPVRNVQTNEAKRHVRVTGQYTHGSVKSMKLIGEYTEGVDMTTDIRIENIRVAVEADTETGIQVTVDGHCTLAGTTVGLDSDGEIDFEGVFKVTNDTQEADLMGSIQAWPITNDVTVTAGKLDLSLKREKRRVNENETYAWGKWDIQGSAEGQFALYGMDLTLNVPIPLSSGLTRVYAYMPKKNIASGVDLLNLSSTANFGGDLSNFSEAVKDWDLTIGATLRIKNPAAPTGTNDIVVDGSIGDGKWTLNANVPELNIASSIKATDLNLLLNGTYGNGPVELAASFDASVELFGQNAEVWAKFTKGAAGMKIDGNAKFPKTNERMAGALAIPKTIELGGCSLGMNTLDFEIEKGLFAFDAEAFLDCGKKPATVGVAGKITGPQQPDSKEKLSFLPSWVPLPMTEINRLKALKTNWTFAEFNGTAANWVVTDNFEIQKIALHLQITREPTVKVHKGFVEGTVLISGLSLAAHVPIPISSGVTTLEGKADELAFGGDTVLVKDLFVKYEGNLDNFLSSSSLTGRATVMVKNSFGADYLKIDVDGSLSEQGGAKFNGQLSNWKIHPMFALTNLEVGVDATFTRKKDNVTCYDDPVTGKCEPALCYEAELSKFPLCDKYVELGYSCNGAGVCARNGCTGDCSLCAKRFVGKIANEYTGRCTTPFVLNSGTVKAGATFFDASVGTVDLKLPFDESGHFELTLADVELGTPDVKIGGKLRVQKLDPQVQLNGTLTALGADFPIVVVGGATENVTQHLSITVDRNGPPVEWRATSDFNVVDVDIDIDARREWDVNTGAWGAISVEGRLMGKVSFGFLYLEVDVPVPLGNGQLSLGAEVPPISVGPGTRLAMKLKGVAQGTNLKELLETVEVDADAELNVSAIGAGGQPASFDLTGKFGKNKVELSGSASDWEIVSGLVLRNLNLDVTNTRSASASNITVDIAATLDCPLGTGITAAATFASIEGQVSFQLDVTGPIDVGGVKINSLKFNFPGKNKPITFSGDATLPSFQGGNPGAFKIAGTYLALNDSTTFEFDGSCTRWEFAPGFAITSLVADIEVSKDGQDPAAYNGEITGSFVLGGIELHASVPIPISSGPVTAEVPSLRISNGVRIDDLKAKVGNIKELGPGASAEVSGTVNITIPFGKTPSIAFDAYGTFGNGEFHFKGTLSKWEIIQGITLNSVDLEINGWKVNGSIAADLVVIADTDLFGNNAVLHGVVNAGGGRGFKMDGNVTWPNGAPEIPFSGVLHRRSHALGFSGTQNNVTLGSLTLDQMDFNFEGGVFDFDTGATLNVEPRPAKLSLAGQILNVNNESAKRVKPLVPANVWEDLVAKDLLNEPKLQYAHIKGSCKEWDISDSVAIRNVAADLFLAKTDTISVTGWIEGEVHLSGWELAAHVPIPPNAPGKETTLSANWTLINMGPVSLIDGSMNYRGELASFANTSFATIVTQAAIDTPFAADPQINLQLEGSASPTSLTVKGSATNWKINEGLVLDELTASAALTKTQGQWSVKHGRIEAHGKLLGGTVSAVSPFPWEKDDALVVSFNSLRIASGVTLKEGLVEVRRVEPQFTLGAYLELANVGLQINGSASVGNLSQSVHLFTTFHKGDTWELTKDIALHNINCDVTVERSRAANADPWGAWNAQGLLEGGFSWANNLQINAHVPLPLDDQTVLSATLESVSLGGAITLGDAYLEYRGDLTNFLDDPKIAFGAWINISTPFAVSDTLPIRVDGNFSKTAIRAVGSIPEWNVVDNMLAFRNVKATFAVQKVDSDSAGASSKCWQASKSSAGPNCFGWEAKGYKCVGDNCARISDTGDSCSTETPGFFVDHTTGKCVDLVCYQSTNEAGCDYSAYTCVGNNCAVNGCVGDCGKCAERKLGFALDQSTGTCEQEICYEADVTQYPQTCDYSAYKCNGDNCASNTCIGDCNSCARRRVGYSASPARGVCDGGKWELQEGVLEAGATILGTTLDNVKVNVVDGVRVDLKGWKLNSDSEVHSGSLIVPKQGPVEFAVDATIRVGPSIYIRPNVWGTVHNSSKFELHGIFNAGWELFGLKVEEVKVDFECSPNAATNSPDCEGYVSGAMEVFESRVEVSVPIPLSNGDAELRMPRIVLAKGTYLEDGLIRRKPTGEWEIEGKLTLKVSDLASPLVMEARAVVTKGCFDITASTNVPWHWDVGQGFTLENSEAKLTVGKTCPGRTPGTNESKAEGHVKAKVSLAGGELEGIIAFDGTDKELNLKLTWIGAQGPTIEGFGSSLSTQAVVPGNGKGGAVTNVCQASLSKLVVDITLNKDNPSIFAEAKVAMFNQDLFAVMHIKKDDMTKKWGFLAALEIQDGTQFDEIEPDQRDIARTLGPLRSAFVVVTSLNTTYVSRVTKQGLAVSPGINFRAVVDVSGVGGVNNKVPSTLTVRGHWSNTGVLIRADLEDFAIGDYVVLNAAAQFSTSDPIFWASGDARVKYRDDAAPMEVTAEVTVWKSGDLAVIGTASNIIFDVGHSGLKIKRVALNVTKAGSALYAHFNGSAFFQSPGQTAVKGIPSASSVLQAPHISSSVKWCDGGKYSAKCAFDNVPNTVWATDNQIASVVYTLDEPRRLTAYSITTTHSHCPTSWKLEGSSVAGMWEVVDLVVTDACANYKKSTYAINSADQRSYRIYRLSFTQSTHEGFRIREIDLDWAHNTDTYALVSGGVTCKLAGFPDLDGEEGQCRDALDEIGLAEYAGPFPTQEDDYGSFPSGCYVQPDKSCKSGWLEDAYGYAPATYNLANQPVKGLTLTGCIRACQEANDCEGFARAGDIDEQPADCYLQKKILPQASTELKHDVSCANVVDLWESSTGQLNREACQNAFKGQAGKEHDWCVAKVEKGYCRQTCCEFWSSQGTATCAGTAGGAPCSFPFAASNGTEYSECIAEHDGENPWCKTVAGPGTWGICSSTPGACKPKMRTYRVKCSGPGYQQLTTKGVTCTSEQYGEITSLEWCKQAVEKLRKQGKILNDGVTEANDENILPGCSRRGSQLIFNLNQAGVPTGDGLNDFAVCYRGNSLWYNPVDPTLANNDDDDAAPLCLASPAGLAMGLDVDIAGSAVNVTLEISKQQSLTPTTATNSLADPNAIGSAAIPNDFLDLLTESLLDLRIFVSTKPVMIQLDATVKLGRVGYVICQLIIIQDGSTGKWGFALGLTVGDSFQLADMLPSSAGSTPEWMQFGSAEVVVSSFQTPYTFGKTTVTYGLAITADLHMNDNVAALKTIKEWTGVHRLVLKVSFGFGSGTFRFEAGIYGRWYIVKPEFAVTGGRFFVEAGPKVTGGINIGMGIDLEVLVDQQVLVFQGEIILSTMDVYFGARMATNWVGPFGLKAVEVARTEIGLGIQYSCPEALGAPCPSRIVLGGGIYIAGQGGTVAVIVNKLNPSDNLFAVAIDYFSLDDILSYFTSVKPSSKDSMSWFLIQGFALSVNPAVFPREFNGQLYPAGIHAKIERFDFLKKFSGGGELTIQPTAGFTLNAYLRPLNLWNIVKIHGQRSATSNAELSVRGTMNPELKISGAVEVLKQKFSLGLLVNKELLDIDAGMSLLGGLIKAELQMKAYIQGGQAGEFNARFKVEQQLIKYLAEQIQQFTNDLKQRALKGLNDAQAEVDAWYRSKKPRVDANNRQIASIRAATTKRVRDAQAKLRSAEGGLRNAQNKVNGLKSEIDRLNRSKKRVSCPWYKAWVCAGQIAHNAWVAVKVGALWVAYGVATGALKVAEAFLRGIRNALNTALRIANAVDPRILALQAENGVYWLAHKAASAGVSAAKAVVNGAAALVNFVVKTLSQLFDIRLIDCTVARVKSSGTTMGCKFAGILIGKAFSLDFSVGFPPTVEQIASSIKNAVSKKVGL